MDEIFTQEQVAARYGVEPETIRDWRKAGKGPRWFKAGQGVRYRAIALARWEEQQEDAAAERETTLRRTA